MSGSPSPCVLAPRSAPRAPDQDALGPWAAVVGVTLFQATVLFGPLLWQGLGDAFVQAVPLLLTGPLLILNLYQTPGGLAGYAFEERDKFLRRS